MDVHSTLVGKIADSGDFTDSEKLLLMLVMMSVDGRKFVKNAFQVVAVPAGTAKLAKRLADQQGWRA